MRYFLPDKVYQVLKWVCMIALNAIGVLYATLAHLWGWPYGVEIPATLEAIAVCIGVLIGISAATAKHAEPSDDHSPETDTLLEDDGSGIRPMTAEEVAAVFEGGEDGD